MWKLISAGCEKRWRHHKKVHVINWKQALHLDIAFAQEKRDKQLKRLIIWFRFQISNQKLPVKTLTTDINLFTDCSREIKNNIPLT
jgi:hypothetical protein